MPTLFRVLTFLGLVFALGYGTLYAVANLVQPEPRLIVEAVTLPRTAEVRTGRSAAERLDAQARELTRDHRRRVTRR